MTTARVMTASALKFAIGIIVLFVFSSFVFNNYTFHHTPCSPRILRSVQRQGLTVASLLTLLSGTHRGAAEAVWCLIVPVTCLALGCLAVLGRSGSSQAGVSAYRGGVLDVLSDPLFFPTPVYPYPQLLGGMREGSPDAPPRGRELPRTPTVEHPLDTPDPRVLRERPSSVPAAARERPGPSRVRVGGSAEDAATQSDRPQAFSLSETPAGGFSPRMQAVERSVERVLEEQRVALDRMRRESVTIGDIQEVVEQAVAQRLADAGEAPPPVWRHRPSIAERIAEDSGYEERLPGVDLTTHDVEITSHLPKRVPDAPKMPEGLSKLALALRLELLWSWLESHREWIDSAQSAGNQLWSCIQRAVSDYVSCWLDRAETAAQAAFTLQRGLWDGGRAGVSATGWCTNSLIWLKAALDEDCIQEFSRITRGMVLNPFQRVCAIYVAVLLQWGFQNLDDVKAILLKIQRPSLFVEGKDGSTWHDELLRWKSLRLIYETILSSSLSAVTGAEGWKDVNPLLVVHSLRDVVNSCARICTHIEMQEVYRVCEQQRIFTSNPLLGSSEILLDALISLFRTSRSIKAYKRPATSKAHAATKETAPKGSAPEQAAKGAAVQDVAKQGGKTPSVPLTREQQSMQDRAKAGFASYHNRDFRSVSLDEVAKSRYKVAGWAAYHEQNRQLKGKGKGTVPPRYGKGSPPPVLPAVSQGVCRDFQQGRCQRGEHCRFAHTAQPAAAPIAPAPAPAPSKGAGKGAPPVCVFWQSWGTCNRQDCKFAHPPEKKGAGLHPAPPSN